MIEDQIADGHKVVIRMLAHITHKGSFRGVLSGDQNIQSTTKPVAMESKVTHSSIRGKIVLLWGNSCGALPGASGGRYIDSGEHG